MAEEKKDKEPIPHYSIKDQMVKDAASKLPTWVEWLIVSMFILLVAIIAGVILLLVR